MSQETPARLSYDQLIAPGYPIHVSRQTARQAVDVHWHEWYELTFVFAGEGRNIVNGTTYHISRGSLWLLTPVDFHEVIPDTPLELINIHFADHWLTPELKDILHAHSFLHMMAKDSSLAWLEYAIERICSELNERGLGAMIAVRAGIEGILIDLVRQGGKKTGIAHAGRTGELHPAIRQALGYIHYHFRESLRLQDAAAVARLSPSYFSHCFHQETGIPFQQYVLDLRLQFAWSLLSASRLSVTEISHAAGFNTLTYFEKVFKRKYGFPPGALRASRNSCN